MIRRILTVLVTIILILGAGWLALRRGDIPYNSLEAVYTSGESEFMTLSDNVKLHYRDEGNNEQPVLVLVHGFSASLHTWEPWVQRLEDDFRVISLDLPGHGLTRTPDINKMHPGHFADVVAEVTDSLGLETFTLVGHSMGGATSWQFALKYPERLDSLVLVAASGWRQDGGDANQPLVFRLLRNPVARAILRDLDTSRLVEDALANSFVDQSFVTDEAIDRYVSLSRAPGHRDGIIALTTGRADRLEATAERLEPLGQIPTLILQGDADNLVAASNAHLFADAIEGAELKIYPNVGHVPQEEVADQSVADFLDFLAQRVYAEDAEIAQYGVAS
ncbi:MAG: alpha/beta hydrolase, partial [Pseudomonadota bacterium]